MIFRLAFMYLTLSGVIFGALWVLFRTSYFNTGRVVEFLKRTALAITALTISAFVIGLFVLLEKLS